MLSQPQLRAWLDQVFAVLEARAQTIPVVGTIIAGELARLQAAADANLDAIYAHVGGVEVLTLQALFDALRAVLPTYAVYLNILQGLIDSALASRLAAPAA